MNEILDEIHNQIVWLDKHVKSDNIIDKGKVLDKLAILSLNLAEEVSEAYSVMNELEDDYKIGVAKFMKDFTGSAAKGEKEAEVAMAEEKRNWTTAKNAYRGLNTHLDRIDKILEAGRQSISVIKAMSLKNMTGT